MRQANATACDAEQLQRVKLGHSMLLRGVPTIYSRDAQGFAGDGGDQDARETLFPGHVESCNDNRLLGTTATTEQANFDRAHPLHGIWPGLRSSEPVSRLCGGGTSEP